MNQDRMIERKAFFTKRQHAKLDGYKLGFYFNNGTGFGSASIVREPKSVVHGALYTLEKGGLEKLDKFEWVDREGYRRVQVTVELDSGEKVECTAYIATEKFFQEGLIPSRTYLNHLLKGKDLLPVEYYKYLENHEYGEPI
ncbi:predicted protein [Nematostella vectensis]|uniref:gamma-glutamylcyclotransferase n=2 Tax=Nematostella vectensis TaxID=45351 RepID=A7RR27_NEMVE|nr:predicted protein [Nematostella vectensis]|eukprot:XP_001638102.1 predicted protein [Nematostella vectensis]